MRQRAQVGERGVDALLRGKAGDGAFAAKQGDKSFGGIGAKPAGIDERAAAVLAVAPGARDQARKVEVAGVVLAQQGRPPGPRVVQRAYPHIAAANRLDPRRAARLIELDQGKQVAFVGERHRRHAGTRARLHHRLDTDGGVDQRVFAVQMQMDEACGHETHAVSRQRLPATPVSHKIDKAAASGRCG